MNRSEFRNVARLRLREARILLHNGCYEGAYYLSGYAVECALKACSAKKIKRFDWPPKAKVVSDRYYTHNLKLLAEEAGLHNELNRTALLAANWAIVREWNEESRYGRSTKTKAEELFKAISARREGVLTCLRRFW